MLGPFKKQPSERVRLAFDFKNRIPVGDTVDSVTSLTAVDLTVPTSTDDILDGGGSPSGKQVAFWCYQGTDGHQYKVSCVILSAQGFVREADLTVLVKDE